MDLIEAEERARWQIAGLLHEDVQQLLAGARLQLQAVSRKLSLPPELTKVEQLLGHALERTRRLSHELSPAVLHHSGLVAALQWVAGRMQEKFGLQVRLETGAVRQTENAHLKVFLFRAVQELLFNVVKHTGTKTARVALSSSDDRSTRAGAATRSRIRVAGADRG